MRQILSSQKFLNKIKLLFFLVFFSLIIFSLYFFLNEYFKVKKINIVNSDFLIGVESLKNKNIFFLNEELIKNKLLKYNPTISNIKIEKKYPSTLTIFLEKEIPLAVFVADDGFFSLSETGKIILKSKKNQQQLPKINYYQKLNFQSYNLGDFLDYKDIIKVLDLIKSIKDLGIEYKIDTIDITGVDMIVFNLEDKKIIFSSEKETKEQIYKLQQIIKKFKIEGRSFKEVDFRFDKTIIRF